MGLLLLLLVACLLGTCGGSSSSSKSIFDVELEDVQRAARERAAREVSPLGDQVGALGVSLSQALQFMTNGWVILREALPVVRNPAFAAEARRAYARRVEVFADYAERWMARRFGTRCADFAARCRAGDRLREVDCCAAAGNATLPYFQALNVHRDSALVAAVAAELGRAAAILLQAPAVRLYQTNVVAKEPGRLNQATGIHRDLHQVPLDPGPAGSLTFWCPLDRDLDGARDSLLHFYQGSHRDLALAVWHDPRQVESRAAEIAATRYLAVHADGLRLGDCTAHHGWLLHRAPPQKPRPLADDARRALTFSFVDADARLLHDIHGNTTRNYRPVNMEDELAFADWYHDSDPDNSDRLMRKVDHPLLPLVYDERRPLNLPS